VPEKKDVEEYVMAHLQSFTEVAGRIGKAGEQHDHSVRIGAFPSTDALLMAYRIMEQNNAPDRRPYQLR